MTEPVAWRVDGTIYNDIKDAEYAVRETEHLRNELEMDNSLIRKPVYIEPLYTAEQLHPRVKMTKEQKEVFLFYKNTTWFSLFLGKLNDPDNKEFRSLPNLNAFKDWGFQKKRECELMQAWLRPETIKVVDE